MTDAPRSSVEASIRNRAAVDAVFGGWSSFHDCLVIGVRLDAEAARAPAVEIDILAPARYERRGEYFHGVDQYSVRLRFHRAAEVALSGFRALNYIGELRLSAVEPPRPEGQGVRVELDAVPYDAAGGGCELALVCDEVEVVSVVGPRPNEALQPTSAETEEA